MWDNGITLRGLLVAVATIMVALWFLHWLASLAFLVIVIGLAAHYLLADGARRLH